MLRNEEKLVRISGQDLLLTFNGFMKETFGDSPTSRMLGKGLLKFVQRRPRISVQELNALSASEVSDVSYFFPLSFSFSQT
jgi:hypothetical protein